MSQLLSSTVRSAKRTFSKMGYSTSIADPLPATFLRGGTSKGIFLTQSSLPPDRAAWTPIFLGIMGSPDAEYGRQLNGMGGGVSSLSKIMVIAPPSAAQRAQGIDVAYTFAQVGIRDASVDYSGNCGNLSSMIGVYAIEEGLCPARTGKDGVATVRAFNTNTQKVVDTTFPVAEDGTPLVDLPQTSIAGVPGKASKIVLDFVDPGGARTGKLLPTGNATDVLEIKSSDAIGSRTVKASLVDATNPTVFVDYAELDEFLPMGDYVSGKSTASEQVGPVLEEIRQEGAKAMGLDPSAQAQPKITLLRAPHTQDDIAQGVDIVVHALSMGVLHKAIPMTVGLCLGVSSKVEGTIAWSIVREVLSEQASKSDLDTIRIRHPGGLVDVGADFDSSGVVKSAKVIRTGRRLMKGYVWHGSNHQVVKGQHMSSIKESVQYSDTLALRHTLIE
ncbi:3-methylitaconate isomerase [Psilocybe cubensis]|uniref:DUF453-domain-containing protein n=2 Tax=Psilocybe cubensis TaxID=181762 RepID=A0A8H7Y3P9_PSICU|nr:3-methylitaconate isomerase [Psilocybe cubensis]KAH9485786.1 3-methylitaconate isomerase [Psilocybe cubensis]